jgi:hypothetical protein
LVTNVSCRQEQKKADVAEHPKEFDHVGLLFNEPPGNTELLFVQSSDEYEHDYTAWIGGTQQPLTDTPPWLKPIPMRTQGEIEAAIGDGISRFEQPCDLVNAVRLFVIASSRTSTSNRRSIES